MGNNTWKWQFIAIGALALALFWPQDAKALDDFNVAKYGPDATVEIGRTDFIVKFTTYPDNATLNEVYKEETGDLETEIAGYSLSHPSYDVCEVHMVMPKIWDDREALTIMGHEILHCMLAEHTDEEGNDLANSGFDNATVTDEDTVLTDEELLKRDRELELEWLKEDYENLGIVITPSHG